MISVYAYRYNPIPNSVWSNGDTETLLFTIPCQNGSLFNYNNIDEFDPNRDSLHPYLSREYTKYNGKVYIFLEQHYGAWDPQCVAEVLPSGLIIQDYIRRRTYRKGEYVTFEGKTYEFLVDYVSGEEWDDSYWEEIRIQPVNAPVPEYANHVQYHIGDYCRYHGRIYQFNVNYIHGNYWQDSFWTRVIPTNWSVHARDYVIGSPQYPIMYYAGEYVRWDGAYYRFNVNYESGTTEWNDSYWTDALPGVPVPNAYTYRKTYRAGEYVRWKGKIYRFKVDYVEGDTWSENYWEEVYVIGFSPQAPVYSDSVQYEIGDYVQWHGNTYRFMHRWHGPSSESNPWDERYWIAVKTISGNVRPFLSAVVNEELGKASSFDFEVDVESIWYDIWRHMRTLVRVEYDGDTIFYGRVLTIDRDMNRTKKIRCEGAYAFFLDSVFEGRKDGYTETLGEYVAQLVDAHNECMAGLPEKHIQLGEVPGHYSSWVTDEQKIKNDTQKFAKQNGYKTIKDWLEEIAKDYGGFMRVRYDNGTLYLDWMKTYFNPNENDQLLSVTSNVVDLSDTVEVDNIFTHVIPMGKNMKYISGETGGDGGDGTAYTITVTVPNGHGTASSNLSKAMKDVQVTLTATPDSGYVFDKWVVTSGDVTISSNKFRVWTSNVSIEAYFKTGGGGGGGIDPDAPTNV